MSRASGIAVFLFVLAAAGGSVLWWRRQPPTPPIAAAPVGPTAPAASPIAPLPAPTPAVRYRVPPAPSPPPRVPSSLEEVEAQVNNALVDLLGRKAVRSFLMLDEIARRVVATVDNLATDNAAAQMWPVRPTAGRLDTELRDGAVVISAKNAERYARFVHLAEALDTQRAVALYVRFYPVLQRAYEELGYPGRYFNDRAVEVIDNLLATPAVAGLIKVKRLGADGAAPRGGELYVFEDSTLETRTAGQKILLRMGHDNAAVVMAKLADIRRRIVAGAPAPTASSR